MAILLFLDTEYTNQNNPKLISIGLKSAHYNYYNQLKLPQKTFYTPYVSHDILPLLNDVFLPQSQLKKSLLTFFSNVKEDIYLVSDEIIDLTLFNEIIGNKPSNLVGYINIYEYFKNMSNEVWGRDYLQLCKQAGEQLNYIFHSYCDSWYQSNNVAKNQALNDAKANEFAFYETEKYLKLSIEEVLKFLSQKNEAINSLTYKHKY